MEKICLEEKSVLPTNNATDGVFFYTSPLTRQPTTKDYLQWLKKTHQFGIFITLQPTPRCLMVDDDMRQRLREIDFWNNKRWLGNKFRQFKNKTDRFLIVGFWHKGHRGKKTRTFDPMMRHLHLMMHCPYDQMNINGSNELKRQMIKNELMRLWLEQPGSCYYNDVRPIPPMHIETIQTKKDADRLVGYCAKDLPKFIPDDEDKRNAYYFFCDE